jgi:hypothetical protein
MKAMKTRVDRPFLIQLLRVSILIACVILADSSAREATSAMQRPTRDQETIDRVLQRYSRVRFDPEEVAHRVHETGEFRFADRDQTLDVVLEPHDMRAPGYRAEEELPGGARRLDAEPAHTYRGIAPALWNSEARFTVKDRSFEGVVLTPEEWYFIEPLRNFSAEADPGEMVVYRRSDIREEALGECGTTLAHRIGEAHAFVEPQALEASSGINTAQIATEADYEFVTASGGAAAANAAILEILNQVDGIYQMELSIALSVTYQHAWSTSDDPYTATAASTMLGEFRSYWNSNYYGVNFDLAHMWTGKDMDGGTIGIAYLGVVCDARYYSYGISQRFTYAPGKYILTAHEIGHNFGASHPDQDSTPHTECSNTIMNSSVGSGFTFCAFSRSEIATYASGSSSCLSSGPAAPSNLTAIAVSASRINLSWQDNSADETGFIVERKTGAAGTWAQVGTADANVSSYSDSGLGTATTYFYRIAASGSAGTSSYSNEASATTLASLPVISQVSPGSGQSGTLVTISGSNLNGTTAVRFNAVNAASFTVVSAAQVTATVPAAASTGYITITTPLGTASSPSMFTVTTNVYDVNSDGAVNVLDMQLVINAILQGAATPSRYDINADGSINVLDLQVLINAILGAAASSG